MSIWVLRGLRDGVVTTRWPARPDAYADGWHGPAHPQAISVPADGLDMLCPTGAIAAAGTSVRVDQGKCIMCGRCVAERPGLFAWSHGATGPGAATLTREALVVPELPETDEAVEAARARLRERTAALRRSVHVRHVDAGSDGSEEWEIQALLGPVYDIHRLGVFFTASPRHADVLLVTGAGARGMAGPLRTTYDGMPDPKVVIAVGADAVSGGLLSESEAVTGGVAATVPVDVWLPGSPPSPFGILNALLIAVGKLASGGKGTPREPKGRGVAWTEERRRSDEGRRGATEERRGKATPPKRPGGKREDRVSGLFAAGLILLALAAVADLLGGRVMRFTGAGPWYLLGAAGSACLAVLGGFALAGRTVRLDVAGWLGDPVPGQQAAALSADRLSGMFLALAFGAAVPVSVAVLARGDDPPLCSPGRTTPPYPPEAPASSSSASSSSSSSGGTHPPRPPLALALGAVAVIMTAQDAFTALFGWETLTLAFYLLAGSERNKPGRAGAAQVTFAFGKVSGAALLAGLLLLAARSHAHTAAKSLLFTSAAGIEAAAGHDDLEELRGSAGGRGGGWGTPWSGFGLAVGSLTLAGLPPTAGFVSEWFLLESLMQQFRVPGLGYRLVLALAGAAVALTVGFAGVTFVRLVGLIVLGRGGDSRRAGFAGSVRAEYGWGGRAAVAVLAASCLAIAAVTPLEIRVIAAGLSPAVPAPVTMGALKSPWILQPVFAGFSILSPSWLWVEMPVMLLLVGLFAWAVSGRRLLRVRRVPAWRSATIGVEGADSYTAFGYANPTRRVLAGVLHTRAELREVMMEDDGRDDGSGAPDRADVSPDAAAHLRYASDVVEVVETYLYRPALGFFMAVVTVAKRLQSGRLDAYLLYMLIALVAVIAVATALA